ncbi:MAG: permease [Eubacteriales bacterium]
MKIKVILKRYKLFLFVLTFNIVLGCIIPELGASSFEMTKSNLLEMLSVIPPIFILLGLLDVWVDKETMMRFLGKGSGIRGVAIAFALGAAAAGPLYAAFPVATVMMKKKASLFNVFIFIGAWSTAKIPLLTFEASSLGLAFAGTRLFINIFGIIAIAFIVEKSLNETQKEEVYAIAEKE